VEKSRTRWEDVVQRNILQILGIRGWRREVRTRENEGVFLGEARAQKEL
jgi:hypothetical protein